MCVHVGTVVTSVKHHLTLNDLVYSPFAPSNGNGKSEQFSITELVESHSISRTTHPFELSPQPPMPLINVDSQPQLNEFKVYVHLHILSNIAELVH